MSSHPEGGSAPEMSTGGGLQRRTIVGAAAWAAPAIVAAAASPAHAASDKPLGTIYAQSSASSIQMGQRILVTGWVDPRTVTVLSVETNARLSFPRQVQTDVDGSFSFVIELTSPATETVRLTISGPGYKPVTQYYIRSALPLGTIAFSATPNEIRNGEQATATGQVTAPAGGSIPSTVKLNSSAVSVMSVPASATVASDGTFSFRVTAQASSGTAIIAASADGYSTADFTVEALAGVPGKIDFTSKPTEIVNGGQATVTGKVTPPSGKALPSSVSLSSSASGVVSVPSSAAVAPDGTFSFVASGKADSGQATISASATGYDTASFTATATAKPVGTIQLLSQPSDLWNGATGNVRGLLVTPPGVTRPSTVSISSSNTAVFTVPATATVAPDGTFSFDATAKASSGTATITVTAADHGSATFTLTATAKPVGVIEFTTAPVAVEKGATGTVQGVLSTPKGLTRPSTVSISSSDTGVFTVPATATVGPDGTFTFDVTAKASTGTATITVTGAEHGSATFVVGIKQLGTIQLINAPSVIGSTGESVRWSGKLMTPSGTARPSTVSISVSDPAVLSAPATATVGSDGSFAFDITALLYGAPQTVTVTATDHGSARSSIQIGRADAYIVVTTAPSSLENGDKGRITGRLDGPGVFTRPGTVSIWSSNDKIVAVPATATVASDNSFAFDATAMASSGTATITISGGATFGTATVTIAATAKTVGTIELTSKPTAVENGAKGNVQGRLVTPAGVKRPNGVSVSSSDTGVFTVPSSVTLASDGTFFFDATAKAASGSATITVTGTDHGSVTFTLTAKAKPVGTIEFTSKPTAVENGAKGNVQGRLVTPAGVKRPNGVSVSSSDTGIFTVPSSVTLASDGTFSFDATAKASSGSATITVTGTDHGSATFTLTATAPPGPVVGSVTLATNAELHPVLSVPLLDESVTFTATVKDTKGAVMAGQDVAFTAPTGTKFSSGSTMTVKTNASGQATVTLLRQATNTPASTVNVQAKAGSVAGTKQLIIVGPEVTVGWDVPAVTRHQSWGFGSQYTGYLWIQNPPVVVAGGKDQWSMSGFGKLTPGLWTKTYATLIYGLFNGNDINHMEGTTLDKPVGARKWTFVVRNADGRPTQLNANRHEVQDDLLTWKEVAKYSAPI